MRVVGVPILGVFVVQHIDPISVAERSESAKAFERHEIWECEFESRLGVQGSQKLPSNLLARRPFTPISLLHYFEMFLAARAASNVFVLCPSKSESKTEGAHEAPLETLTDPLHMCTFLEGCHCQF